MFDSDIEASRGLEEEQWEYEDNLDDYTREVFIYMFDREPNFENKTDEIIYENLINEVSSSPEFISSPTTEFMDEHYGGNNTVLNIMNLADRLRPKYLSTPQ